MSTIRTLSFGEGKELTVQFGELARQANFATTIKVGDTIALIAVVTKSEPREGIDFFPLMVDYREKFYASGRIPGGFFRREGRPGENETLYARLIDRAIRPLFPENYRNEVQVYITILSMDQENCAEIPALIGASLSLFLSDIPFDTPIGAVRIGYMNGEFVVNPTYSQLEECDLEIIAAGVEEGINMVEVNASEVSEDIVMEALQIAHEHIKKIIEMQKQLRAEFGREKQVYEEQVVDEEIVRRVRELCENALDELNKVREKEERDRQLNEIHQTAYESLAKDFPERENEINQVIQKILKEKVRQNILSGNTRPDGRSSDQIRDIKSIVALLPRTHGSAVFTRGQTQSLAVLTLGTPDDQQMIDNLMGISKKRFMLHYNFPSYSVGEVSPPRGPGRREIGHGALAARALTPILPDEEHFPYTIRLVSEILESNGSSSMASVCSATLSLMDGGVPIKAPVAGIAMGLVKEGDTHVVLSDIMGLEDHMGDMDFKVAGTENGITAIQLDLKRTHIDFDIFRETLEQARLGRLFILQKMLETLPAPRPEISPLAPRITVIQIDVNKIRDVIGPGGKIIRSITERTGAKVEIEDDGKIYVSSVDEKSMNDALEIIEEITADVETGKVYKGKVTRIMPFGAIVEILPNKDGLVHISELDHRRVESVEDVCREGDSIEVKVLEVSDDGRIRLSHKATLPPPSGSDRRQKDRRDSREPNQG